MAATVYDMTTRRLLGMSLEQQAHEAILKRLRGQVTGTILAQAQCRAARLVASGVKFGEAINRVCAWATCADHPEPPSAA